MFKYLVIFLLVSFSALAAEDPRFSSSSSDEFEKGFSESKGLKDSEKALLDADRLKIGGTLQGEFRDSILEGGTQNDYYQNPWTLQMYMDAKLKHDIRAYALARHLYDPAINSTLVSPLTGQTQRQEQGSLDELKFQFHMARKVFWTVGLQKIKWGVGRFWNPTDFMNTERRNYFYADDFRAGLPMVKAHVPVGNANVYGIFLEQTGNEFRRNGGAFRVEVPFSFGEISFSALSKYQTPVYVGADFSIGVGDFDIYGEAAQQNSSADRSAVGGVGYDFKYNDEDVMGISIEGFWQGNGKTDTSQYLTMLTSGTFVPFYVGQVYAMLAVNLLAPGSWNDTNWSLYYIRNQSDSSDYIRASFTYSGMQDLIWIISGGYRMGSSSSEMRLGGQRGEISVLAKLTF